MYKIQDSVGGKGNLQLSSPKPVIECTCAESLKVILYRYFTAVSNITKSALSIMIKYFYYRVPALIIINIYAIISMQSSS